MKLTLSELAEKYNLSESSIKTNFKRAKESLYKKYGITVEKYGRGDKAYYEITEFEHTDPNRAITLYKSMEQNIIPSSIAAGLLDLNFLVFIGIISSPMRAFRGSYEDLLKYLELKVNPENIQSIRASLRYLEEQEYIMYGEDPTDTNYFMAGVMHKTETDMILEIKAILHFKKLLENSRKSWIPVMKVYLALHYIDQPFTLAQLQYVTGLTEYKARDCLKFLQSSNIINKELKYYCDKALNAVVCLGSEVDINAFGIPK